MKKKKKIVKRSPVITGCWLKTVTLQSKFYCRRLFDALIYCSFAIVQQEVQWLNADRTRPRPPPPTFSMIKGGGHLKESRAVLGSAVYHVLFMFVVLGSAVYHVLFIFVVLGSAVYHVLFIFVILGSAVYHVLFIFVVLGSAVYHGR